MIMIWNRKYKGMKKMRILLMMNLIIVTKILIVKMIMIQTLKNHNFLVSMKMILIFILVEIKII